MTGATPQAGVNIPDPPRPVPAGLYCRRLRGMFFIGLIFLISGPAVGIGVIGSMMRAVGGSSPFSDLILDGRHEAASATVTAKRLIQSVHVDSQHPWRIHFRFEPADGGSILTSGFTYDQELGSRVATGDQIEIQYDPADPFRARPVGGYAASTPPWVFLLMVGIFGAETLIGAFMLGGAIWLSRRERRLLAYGVAADADVLAVRRIWYIHFGSKHPYDVYYRFRDHHGVPITGRDRTYSYAWAEALRPGDRVGIVFNPRNPLENALWLHGRELERLGGRQMPFWARAG